jgi:hypothetical protein
MVDGDPRGLAQAFAADKACASLPTGVCIELTTSKGHDFQRTRLPMKPEARQGNKVSQDIKYLAETQGFEPWIRL